MEAYRETLEKIFKFFNRDPFQNEVNNAKKEYFERVGAVFEEDPFFEMRLAAFFDWFVFDRPVKDVGLPPIKIYYQSRLDSFTESEREIVVGLSNTQLSIWIVKKETDGEHGVIDLYNQKMFKVPKVGEFGYTGVGNIAEGRIMPYGKGHAFTDPVFSHPKEVTEIIKREAKKRRNGTREEFSDFVMTLAAMNVRQYRYRHLKIDDVYKFSDE